VRSVVTDLRLDHAGEHVAIVTHQAVIQLFRYVLESLTEAEVLAVDRRVEVANTAVTTYRSVDGGPPVLVGFNDVAHLPAALRTAAPDVPVAPR
jgi:broad specificity phosphatase PhoE